jgi:peroxiredoxin
LIASGDQSLRQKKNDEAFRDYEKANKLRGDKCFACLIKMTSVKIVAGDEDAAMKYSRKALEVAANAVERSQANAWRGEALSASAKGEKKKLAAAEDAYRAAAKDDPNEPAFMFKLGGILLREEKDAEGKAALQACLSADPRGPFAETARKWIDDPRRARLPFAPDFSLTTVDGKTIKLSELAGKVVILDFWATWCPPCRATVPELKELVAKYPADKLVVISVSADRDDAKWRSYIAEKKMTWNQYRDSDEHVMTAYNIHSFPTLFLIDKEGIIRDQIRDFNEQMTVIGRFKDPLKKMLQ